MTSVIVISKQLFLGGLPAERFVLELARKWPTLIKLDDCEGTIQTSVMEQSTQLGYRIASLGDP